VSLEVDDTMRSGQQEGSGRLPGGWRRRNPNEILKACSSDVHAAVLSCKS
jgi:hypothetical protein